MPQEFQVLQCFSCKTFQVHQVKKAKKWACKLCGEKQSIIKVYGKGTGAECRQHVQKLNTQRGELDQHKETLHNARTDYTTANLADDMYLENDCDLGLSVNTEPNTKWAKFVVNRTAADFEDDSEDDTRYTTDASVLDRGKKSRKRKHQQDTTYKNRVKSSKVEDTNPPMGTLGYCDDVGPSQYGLGNQRNHRNSVNFHKSVQPMHSKWKNVQGIEDDHGSIIDEQDLDIFYDEDNTNLKIQSYNVKSNLSKWNVYTGINEVSSQNSDEYNNEYNVNVNKDVYTRPYDKSKSLEWTTYSAVSDTSSQDSVENNMDRNCIDRVVGNIDTRPYVELGQLTKNQSTFYPVNSTMSSTEMSRNTHRNNQVTQTIQSKKTTLSKWGVFLAASDSDVTCTNGNKNVRYNKSSDDENPNLITTENWKHLNEGSLSEKPKFPATNISHASEQMRFESSNRLQRQYLSATNTNNNITGCAASHNIEKESHGGLGSIVNSAGVDCSRSFKNQNDMNRQEKKKNLPVTVMNSPNVSSMFSVGELTDEDFEL